MKPRPLTLCFLCLSPCAPSLSPLRSLPTIPYDRPPSRPRYPATDFCLLSAVYAMRYALCASPFDLCPLISDLRPLTSNFALVP